MNKIFNKGVKMKSPEISTKEQSEKEYQPNFLVQNAINNLFYHKDIDFRKIRNELYDRLGFRFHYLKDGGFILKVARLSGILLSDISPGTLHMMRCIFITNLEKK